MRKSKGIFMALLANIDERRYSLGKLQITKFSFKIANAQVKAPKMTMDAYYQRKLKM